MKHFHKKRLLKLAEFLDKLPRKKFYFGAVIRGTDIPTKALSCGSVGCAIGWCPVVFPRLAKYAQTNPESQWGIGVRPIEGPPSAHVNDGFNETAESLFGLTSSETTAVFNPYWGDRSRETMGLKPVHTHSTPKRVAKNIRLFLKYKEKEAK